MKIEVFAEIPAGKNEIRRTGTPGLNGLFLLADASAAGEIARDPFRRGAARIGVFKGAALHTILENVAVHRLDLVLLAGEESPGFCAAVSGFLPAMKVFDTGAETFGPEVVKGFENACDFFLFEAGPDGGPAIRESVRSFLENYSAQVPFFLSPELAEQVLTLSLPQYSGTWPVTDRLLAGLSLPLATEPQTSTS